MVLYSHHFVTNRVIYCIIMLFERKKNDFWHDNNNTYSKTHKDKTIINNSITKQSDEAGITGANSHAS